MDGGTELLVCIRCRREGEEADERPGARLHRALTRNGVAGVAVRGVECLSNCPRGCTVALRGPGRWTYVYGDLDPDADLGAVREGAALYHATADGLVPWRVRPERFRRGCIARIPPLEA